MDDSFLKYINIIGIGFKISFNSKLSHFKMVSGYKSNLFISPCFQEGLYEVYDYRDPRGSGYKSAISGTCNQSSIRLKQTTHELSDLDQVIIHKKLF